MRVLFLVSGGGGFPQYGAYANRVISMARGLHSIGQQVEIVYVFSGKYNLSSKSGTYENIRYLYMIKPQPAKNKFHKALQYIHGIIGAILYIYKVNKIQPIILISCFHGFITNPIWLITRWLKIPIIRELNEFPFSTTFKNPTNLTKYDIFKIRMDLFLFSGFISISTQLQQFLVSLFPDKPNLHIPINVQPENFSHRVPSPINKYITYVGTISNYKDGISDLLQAFFIAGKEVSDIYLRLIGGGSKDDIDKLKGMISKSGFNDRVSFTGLMDRKQAVNLMLESYILVLARPDNTLALGGFPTKLGEYLATGIPVLVTAVGDIPLF